MLAKTPFASLTVATQISRNGIVYSFFLTCHVLIENIIPFTIVHLIIWISVLFASLVTHLILSDRIKAPDYQVFFTFTCLPLFPPLSLC